MMLPCQNDVGLKQLIGVLFLKSLAMIFYFFPRDSNLNCEFARPI